MKKTSLLCLAACAAGLCLPTLEAAAESSLLSSVAMRASNDFGPEPPNGGFADLLADDFTTGPGTVSLDRGFSFGDEGDLSFFGTATAATSYQRLRAGVTGNVSGASYDSQRDTKYFDQDTREVDFNGKPDYFGVDAESQFTETLQYGGLAVGYTSRYYLNLSGSVGGIGAFVYVEVNHATSGRAFTYFGFETGDYDIPIETESFVGAANQQFTIRMLTSFQVDTFDGGTADLSGNASFGSTLEFLGVEVREQDTGRLLAVNEISSDSGTTYAVVPEPATALLTLAGVPLLARRARRR